MTVIAAIADGRTVWMGGDSLSVLGNSSDICKRSKVFRLGECLIGCAGDTRFGQLVEYRFTPPAIVPGETLECYVSCKFIETLRECFKTGGFTQFRDGVEYTEGLLLLGIRGRLFSICGGFSFHETAWHYDAIGSGSEVAVGAIYNNLAIPPHKLIRRALEAAERHVQGCRGPFTILSLGESDEP